MYNFIDIHGHVNFPDFDVDRDLVLKRAESASVAIINVGTDLETSKSALELAKSHENMWATVGIHPTDATADFESEKLSDLAIDKKAVAIGECGLDYFHGEEADFARQRDVFERQIALANSLDKPLMLHVRNGRSNRKAYADALRIMRAVDSKVAANFHFFAGTIQDLKEILDTGHSVSFTGVLTFARDYDELVRYVPISRIMSETDCPFVAPVPFRGKRNEPAYVVEVAKAIANIRGMEQDLLYPQLVHNAREFFRIAL